MPNLKPIIFKVLILFFVLSCTTNNLEDSENIEGTNPLEYLENLDVSYGNDSNQKFDIYLPPNRTTDTKVIILVHGGGWSAGDKSDMIGFKDLIFQSFSDIAVVNMNYRLADENNSPYPMQTDDITTVINHLKTNRNNYVIDDDFGFIGTSAGAHLSLLWSYTSDTDNNVKMVCSIVGPTNFTDPAYLNNTNPELQALIDLFGGDIPFLEEISPYHRVTVTAPPTILFYGGQDPLIPTTQGTAMRDKLVELGVTQEFTLYENEGHGWTGDSAVDTWLKLKTFIENYLE
ncbi:Lipase [hydrothermal vent metagenome]|uniref:Lipase n=1 Tax=hydrothermal vent metagenome TaxID=652676 RepID=A0A3B0QRC5_9ZZZZ